MKNHKITCTSKINLFLKIINKRPDNYHNLFTLMSHVDICDYITIKKSDDNKKTLKITGTFADLIKNDDIETNLIIKSLNLISSIFNVDTNFDIELEKNIPIGAGMGGGSSNAGNIIKFCNDYFKLNLKQNQLIEIGKKIGADVPFFVQENISLCQEIGDKITNIKTNFLSKKIIIIKPSFNINTAGAFGRINLINFEKGVKDSIDNFAEKVKQDYVFSFEDLIDFSSAIKNDFFEVLDKTNQDVNSFLTQLQLFRTQFHIQMTGSGSAFFCLPKQEIDIEKTKQEMQKILTNCKIFDCNILCCIEN